MVAEALSVTTKNIYAPTSSHETTSTPHSGSITSINGSFNVLSQKPFWTYTNSVASARLHRMNSESGTYSGSLISGGSAIIAEEDEDHSASLLGTSSISERLHLCHSADRRLIEVLVSLHKVGLQLPAHPTRQLHAEGLLLKQNRRRHTKRTWRRLFLFDDALVYVSLIHSKRDGETNPNPKNWKQERWCHPKLFLLREGCNVRACEDNQRGLVLMHATMKSPCIMFCVTKEERDSWLSHLTMNVTRARNAANTPLAADSEIVLKDCQICQTEPQRRKWFRFWRRDRDVCQVCRRVVCRTCMVGKFSVPHVDQQGTVPVCATCLEHLSDAVLQVCVRQYDLYQLRHSSTHSPAHQRRSFLESQLFQRRLSLVDSRRYEPTTPMSPAVSLFEARSNAAVTSYNNNSIRPRTLNDVEEEGPPLLSLFYSPLSRPLTLLSHRK